jgi:hypothetical protein
MLSALVRSIQSEWLKTRRSLVLALVAASGFFVPVIVFLIRIRRPANLPALYRAPGFWEALWTQVWESMAIMILPIFIVLAVSLVTQIEYRNNAWKQLHASPQPLTTIFFAKLTVILAIVVQLLVVLNIGIYLTAVVPALIFRGVSLPASPIPYRLFLVRDLRFFVDSLPIVAAQYLLALRCRNFMVPLGMGMAGWVLSVGSLSSAYNYLVPYSYTAIDYLMESSARFKSHPPADVRLMALVCFAVFTMAGLALYVTKRDRG